MNKCPPLMLLLALAACDGTANQNAAELADVAATETNTIVKVPETNVAVNAQLAAPAPASMMIGPLRVPYDAARLTPIRTSIPLPPDWSSEARAVKLIASDRAELIGKAECMYGQAGQANRCNALQEAGLAFAALNRDYEQMRAALPADQRRSISLAGAEGVSWLIGAEGEGAEYILLPVAGGTVMIVRQFRNSGNPDEGAVGTVLSDISLTGTQ